ncbi:hypothetical protein ABPG73_019437 [Tetrahymena malaccensis]
MENTLLQDSLEFYWISSNEDNKLHLPDNEVCQLSSKFKKRIGDSEQYEDCELKLYSKRLYIIQRNNVIAFLKFCFEMTFELVIEGDKDHELENIKQSNFKSLKIEKDMCDCEFISADKKVYVEWQSKLAERITQKNFYAYYDVKRVIGSGAYASVVIAEKKVDGSLFAVKSLSKAHIYQTTDGKAEIENELALMRLVRHKNVMRLFEVFDADSSIKIVLELVEGGQLFDLMKKNPNLTWFEIGLIMKQILSGLEALHSQNIMHRDLKPENILMRSKESLDLVIGDFGLAQKADSKKYLYLKCGTPGYVAPEVINLKEDQTHYETQCDIFSAGAIFYKLCVHKPLFQGVTHAEVLQENKSVNFNLNCQDVKDLPPLAQDLLKQLLKCDPKQRITATEALKHKFFKDVTEKEGERHKSPFKGDVEKMRHLIKQEKKRNEEMPENSPLKMKQPLITGKTKPIQPHSTVTKRGSFIQVQSSSNNSSRRSSKNSNLGLGSNQKKASLDSIEEGDEDQKKELGSGIKQIDNKRRNLIPTLNSLKQQPTDGIKLNRVGFRRATVEPQSDTTIKGVEVKDPITPVQHPRQRGSVKSITHIIGKK